MGNCCGIHGSTTSLGNQTMPRRLAEMEGSVVSGGGQLSGGGQVRIRISKQQLHELLRRVELDQHHLHYGRDRDGRKRMRAEEVLQRLIDKSHHVEVHHQGPWRPSLESIKEVRVRISKQQLEELLRRAEIDHDHDHHGRKRTMKVEEILPRLIDKSGSS
ncbi:hypothetical protein Cgig2_011232 [Carnegiea gigantea]|uniref:Uncharacterized protein n=1 Tax=Carnegiea gigantea TaxID=171969 RepID=A0A9Q1KF19_9CARY|nr:hypothetical protein Cgig2_011232 [Carnegiea gigantea]